MPKLPPPTMFDEELDDVLVSEARGVVEGGHPVLVRTQQVTLTTLVQVHQLET